MKKHDLIVVTAGEPAGIGPDLIIQIAQHNLPCPIVVIGDAELLSVRAEQLKLPLQLNLYEPSEQPQLHTPGKLAMIHTPMAVAVEPGKPDKSNAHAILETLKRAHDGCIQKEFAAMVTAPIHKASIMNAGIQFTGHTEYLASFSQTEHVVMMLMTDKLKVGLVTTHLPLSEVPKAITHERLRQSIEIVNQDLKKRFAIANPKLIVCGLNPHAGEEGHLGREEIEVINPVLTQLREEGLQIVGPLPADTIFLAETIADADAIVCMYHDQGLPVIKYSGFGQAVNVTLGLPIIRTSVDHGTAFSLAGTGKANPGSLMAAIEVAHKMAQYSQ